MEGGPPCFPLDSSCPVVLWILPGACAFRLRDFYSLWFTFPGNSAKHLHSLPQSSTPKLLLALVWPLSRSLAATWKIVLTFFSSAYLDVSVQRVSPRTTMHSLHGDRILTRPGFPIRTSADQWIFAPPRGFSQLVTSFFGS